MRGGIDRGPCFFYRRLSYCRKFIRDCWLLPTLLLLLTLLLLSGVPRFEAGWLGLPWDDQWGWWYIAWCAVLSPIWAAYNLARWRLEVRAARRNVSFYPETF
jgi:hypothetical protein